MLYVALGFVTLLIVAAIAVSFRPSTFQVSRSTTIHAPAEVVFPHVNRLAAWGAWSPFEKVDPTMTKTYEGPESGEGASMQWQGNWEAGSGRATIVRSIPNEEVQIDLEMKQPFECSNDVVFDFKPSGKDTIVSWTMTGEVGYFGKIMHLVISMDKMVGGQFEKGLADLKAIAENQSVAATH